MEELVKKAATLAAVNGDKPGAGVKFGHGGDRSFPVSVSGEEHGRDGIGLGDQGWLPGSSWGLGGDGVRTLDPFALRGYFSPCACATRRCCAGWTATGE